MYLMYHVLYVPCPLCPLSHMSHVVYAPCPFCPRPLCPLTLMSLVPYVPCHLCPLSLVSLVPYVPLRKALIASNNLAILLLDESGQITTTSSENGSKNRILENLCEQVIEIYSWENWKSAKYDPLLGLIFYLL